jgi:outer membrane lipoprotein-sorting protein
MKQLLASLAVGLLATACAAQAQSVDEIIAKNIEAHGGLDKMQAITSIKSTGKLMQMGMEFPFTNTMKRPGNFRIESTIQGQTFIMAYNGSMAWSINPFAGSSDPQKMSDEELKTVKDQGDFDGPLVDYRSKGKTIELIGKEEIEGTPVHKLKITDKEGDITYMYLDTETGIELKTTTILKLGDKEVESDTYYSDFKEVAGVMMPHSIESRMGGQVANQIVIDKMEVNVPVDASIFTMPASSGTASTSDAEKSK